MVTVHQPKRNNQVNFIIVGQGIAGSAMALTLIKKGFKVCVVDQPMLSISSQVAAGIWNPVVFKRLTKSWMADELVDELIDFYRYWEQQCACKLLHQKNIIKPFTEEQEKNLWLKKSDENSFLSKKLFENFKFSNTYTVKSYAKVLGAGNLHVKEFLKHARQFIQTSQLFMEEVFEYSELQISPQTITYKNTSADHIIFCEGHLISSNPYFSYIPLKPAKGEVITIRSQNLNLTGDIFNKGFFILPLGDNLYKVGATYEWAELNDEPSKKGLAELKNKLDSVLGNYEIVLHEAGVRPAVIDRRPVMGCHPDHKNLFVFNGMGTKGVMLAPYFAKHLASYIIESSPINPEVNVSRFKPN